MRLPNGERTIVGLRKLRDYCLNPDSTRGRHKARVFATALGITTADAATLRTKLLEVARTGDAQTRELDLYGQRDTIDFALETAVGKATVRSGWIVLHGKPAPRLTTCSVRKRTRHVKAKD